MIRFDSGGSTIREVIDLEDSIKWLQDKKVDIPDLLVWLTSRWKFILTLALTGCILGVLACAVVSLVRPKEEAPAADKPAAFYSKNLSAEEALEVENTHKEYRIFQNYISDLGRFSTVFPDSENTDGKILIAKYDIVSRLDSPTTYYTDLAVSSEDYKKIYEIAYPDAQSGDAAAANRVNPLSFISDIDGRPDVHKADGNDEGPAADASSLTLFIKADTEEQCKEILAVVNASFKKETLTLQKTDKAIACHCADTGYASDQKSFYDNAERMVVERLEIAADALSSLKAGYIEKFSKNQKAYFDALNSSQAGDDQDKKNADAASSDTGKTTFFSFLAKNFLKFALAGLLIGFVLAVCLMVYQYLTNGKIKTKKELANYSVRVLDTLYFIKTNSLIYNIVRRYRKVQMAPSDVQMQMLAEDMAIMMKNTESGKLYFLMTCNTLHDKETARQLKKLLEAHDLTVISGNPFRSVDELKDLSEADTVIILAHIKVSRRDAISRAKELCDRYSREIFGFIAIEEY